MKLLWEALLLPLTLTLVLEVPAGALILRKKSAVFPLIAINTLTNVTINLIMLLVRSFTSAAAVRVLCCAAGEAAVVISEGMFIASACGETRKKSLIVSAVLNVFSFACGLLIF